MRCMILVMVTMLTFSAFAEEVTMWKCSQGTEDFLGYRAEIQVGHPDLKNYLSVNIFRLNNKTGYYFEYIDQDFYHQYSAEWKKKLSNVHAKFDAEAKTLEIDFYNVNQKGSFRGCSIVK